ncbi:MAG: replication protein P [Pseudomonadota bacterium]
MTTPLATSTAAAAAAPTTRPFSQWFEPHAELGISLMDHLYNRLDGAYPHKWRANFPDEQAIDNWAESWVEAFEEEGITPIDVKAGLKACRSRFAWPPSCAEFIQACKPHGDATGAYHEAVAGLEARGKGERGSWSHPAIFWAATLLQRDLMGQTYSAVKDRWAAALKAQLERTEWAEIPMPRVQLAAPGKTKLSREGAAQMLRELEAQGVITKGITKKSGDNFDHKRWARRLLERVANGDKGLTIYQTNAASESLGLPVPGQLVGA